MKRSYDEKCIRKYIESYNLQGMIDEKLMPHLQIFNYDKGELIISQNSSLHNFFILVEGKLKVYMVNHEGKSILIRFNQPPSLLGDIEIFTGLLGQCHVEAVTTCTCLAVSMDIIREHSRSNVDFLTYVIQNLSYKLNSISNSAAINLMNSLESRFASYLLSMSNGPAVGQEIPMKLPKLTEIAPLLGTSYRHLSRIVNTMVKQGIITRNRSHIMILDLEQLKEISQGYTYDV